MEAALNMGFRQIDSKVFGKSAPVEGAVDLFNSDLSQFLDGQS